MLVQRDVGVAKMKPIAACLVLAVGLAAVPTAAIAKKEYMIEHEQQQWGEPKADQALVYILRPATTWPTKIWAFADKRFLGVTKSDVYTFAYVSPGEHVFWSKAENVNAIKMNVEAGKVYYIQQHVQPGMFKMAVELEVLDEPRAKELFKQCKYVTATDLSASRAQKVVTKSYKEAQAAASSFPETRRGKDFTY